jgi:uncharacterized protein with GYD domain
VKAIYDPTTSFTSTRTFHRRRSHDGAPLKAFYLVMGEYDAVAIAEAPNDEVVAKLALATAALGNVRTRTSRAFTEDEDRRIIASLS